MSITKLDQLFDVLKSKPKKRLVAAYANDDHTIEAVSMAVDMGIVEATLVGDEKTIKEVCAKHKIDPAKFRIVQENDEMKAANKAVELINKGEGNVLMKGLVSTDKYMRAILNKETGLMPPKAVLSHVTVVQVPTYPKLLVVGDVAIIPAPDISQKIAITNYLVDVAHSLGIEKPKVALLAATEQVSTAMPACVDATIISKMGDRGQIKNALIDGPLALDVAIDKESAQIKKLTGEVAGDADCILFPNIESGNVFFKACTKLAKGELGAMVVGAKVPCVLTSRGDSVKSKMYSIALAANASK
ncbi:MAG: bifunctional enoyl-CoA hydratase/phosphate acetyltransferase [Tenuifilaceae bacterium]|jgi:phosphate butyryltransferase|nr:bifunctional enoyl-CoA hydratase/phosphate acetyltransferase [Bacteroidales bacterium]MDI9515735.1 bifunctional enoyl-CoA hydratase/phosphate acetyltransferase [Bacteroidota bacterium]OQC64125.1 MAG: Phosphate acetyltransferase [Bacteroidetes bacterium ADurb.Bin008]HNV81398.1 bifunctional enoyl-CoA hydratase/phosphate acetyltransferase [Tenuifilaceae bacterium]MZP81751.1 bifunctional enoyl-CoA hydratase/phosphate acetyltransferase [Bacteroidales bacterium]